MQGRSYERLFFVTLHFRNLYNMSIRVENIVKRYGNQLALDHVSFSVEKGGITGFLGPNGAGKSTLMKILTGYLLPDEGEATVDAMKVNPEHTDFKYRIGYLPELNPLYPEMYIKEYLKMVAGIYRLDNPDKKVENVIGMIGLTPEVSKKIGELSKGYKQRVGLAQALIHDPSVLILDEPTTGLDPNQLDEIRSLIKDISIEKTVLLSTHIMQEVEALCSRVIIINKGKLVADGTSADLKGWSRGLGQKVVFSTLEKKGVDDFSSLPFVEKVESVGSNEYLLTSTIEDDMRPELFKAAVKNGWTIIKMAEQADSFEEIFRDLTR
jgi:ABC-2 type transport system ATP-binding protein